MAGTGWTKAELLDPNVNAKGTYMPWMINGLKSPQVMALMDQPGEHKVTIDVGRDQPMTVTVKDGVVTETHMGGSIWGPLLAAAAVATGGILGPAAVSALGGSAAGGGGTAAAAGSGYIGSSVASTAAGLSGGAAATAGGILSGIGGLTGAKLIADVGLGLWGQHQASSAADNAAALQSNSAAETLKFLREQDAAQQAQYASTQAENKRQFDTTQQLNLDQHNERAGNLSPYVQAGRGATSTLNNLIGLPETQPYVPTQKYAPGNPGYVAPGANPASALAQGTPAPTAGAPATLNNLHAEGAPAGAPAGQVDGSPQSIAAYFASRGVTPEPTSVGYFAQKWPELVARGQEIGDPNYAMKRLAAANEFGGGTGAVGVPTGQPYQAPTLNSLMTQFGSSPTTSAPVTTQSMPTLVRTPTLNSLYGY